MARPRAVAAVLLATTLVLLAGLALLSFDATTLGRAVLARAGAATGVALSARSFRLRPATGLTIEGLEGSAVFTGGKATVSVERLVLDHRLWRLVLGELAVDRLVLRRPHIRLAETRVAARATKPVAGAAAASLGRLALRVSRIDVEDGTIEMQALGEPRPVVVSGLDLVLREVGLDAGQGALLAALRGTGDLRVAQVAFARTQARDVRGTLRMGLGRLTTDAVRFATPQGPFEATLEAEVDRLPFAYTLSLRGEPIDIASMMVGAGRGPGPGALRLDGRGVGAEAVGLKAKGTLRLQAGALPATPLLTAVERLLGRTRLVGARYEATEAPFRVEGGRVLLEDLRLRTEHMGMDVRGWASLDGPLQLAVAIHTPRKGLTIEGVAAGMLDLMTDDQGQVVIPLEVTGTQEVPRVRPDVAALAAGARRSGARTLLDKAGRGLGGLLRGKKRTP